MSSLKPPGAPIHDNQPESLGSAALSPPSSITYASSTSSIATNPNSENIDGPSSEHSGNYHQQRHHASPIHRQHQNSRNNPTAHGHGYRNVQDQYQNPLYRSNSLQRPKGRGQALQLDQYQKQRSRTPNPSMNIEQYGYHMQMHAVQYDHNSFYAQEQQQYVNYNYNNNAGHMRPNYSPYKNQMNLPPGQMEGQYVNGRMVGRSQSQKVPMSHLRKPTQYMSSPNPMQQQQQQQQYSEGNFYENG